MDRIALQTFGWQDFPIYKKNAKDTPSGILGG
jgi:hypothetical protein